jgi:hypothetical protein
VRSSSVTAARWRELESGLEMTRFGVGAPVPAAQVGLSDARVYEGGGGWPTILSSLKSLLETGESF